MAVKNSTLVLFCIAVRPFNLAIYGVTCHLVSEWCIGDVVSVRGPMINGCVLYGATKFRVTTTVYGTYNYSFRSRYMQSSLFNRKVYACEVFCFSIVMRPRLFICRSFYYDFI